MAKSLNGADGILTFDELYQSLLQDAVHGEPLPRSVPHIDPRRLDYLLHPEKHPPVWVTADCSKCGGDSPECRAACLFQAIERLPGGELTIDAARCAGCASCISACRSGALTASRDILPALNALKQARAGAYALIAPSFHGQFSPAVSPGKLRSAFRALGFTDMVEVSLFADVITLKEAVEFDRHIDSSRDFQLTSCCCPVWTAMVRSVYQRLASHMPCSVSPMIAAGRTIKALHPHALTVFIGPCLAKKAEARAPELRGAVDWVLTYEELRAVFEAADIRPESLSDAKGAVASRAGRLYGRAGGVSEAVRAAVARLDPGRGRELAVCRADGVSDCRAMLEKLQAGEQAANFYEGMGCVGGCVGGPKAIIDREAGRRNIDAYGEMAEFQTPLDNPYVKELLRALGFETVEAFLADSGIFTRAFVGDDPQK